MIPIVYTTLVCVSFTCTIVLAQPDIIPVPGGVVITSQEEVRSINTYATIYVALDFHPEVLQTAWASALNQLRNISNHAYEAHEFHYKALHTRIDMRINWLLKMALNFAPAPLQPTRIKRQTMLGPLKELGSIGAHIFGLATAGDIKTLAEVNQKLAGSIDGVIRTQRKVIATVNQLGHAQAALIGQVNVIIDNLHTLTSVLLHTTFRLTVLEGKEILNRFTLEINIVLDLIHDQMLEYNEHRRNALLARTSCEAMIVSENLVPLHTLHSILAQSSNHVAISPAAYYQYLQVQRLTFVRNVAYCVIQAPLMDDELHQLYRISTFPTCNTAGCYQIYHDVNVVMGTSSEKLYFPERCIGQNPTACQPGVVYAKNQQPCLHGLISGDHTQQVTCPVTYTKEPAVAHPVSTHLLNRYILRTDPTLYHYRCSGRNPFTSDLAAGTYIITLEPECDLDAGAWILHGIKTLQTTLNITIPLPQPIDLSHLAFENDTQWKPIDLPKGIKQLEFPTYTNLVAPKQTNYESEVQEMQKDLGKTHYFWLWIAIGIGAALALAVFVWKVTTTNRARKALKALTLGSSLAPQRKTPTPELTRAQVHYDPVDQSITINPELSKNTASKFHYGTQTEESE